MENQNKAYLFAGLSVLCWSTVATAFKIALEYQSPYSLLLWSSVTSLLFFFILVIIKGDLNKIIKSKFKDLFKSAFYGFLNPFLYYIVLFEAYARLSAQEAQSLNYSWGIVLGIFSVLFLNQKFKIINFIALCISFFGVILISTKGDIAGLNFTDRTGVALALGSSVIWATFWLANIKDKRNDIHKLFLNFFFGAIYIIIFMLIRGFEPVSTKSIFSAVYVGIFEMGITFFFWISALKFSEDTSKVSNIIFLSPFLSLVLISLVLKESIYISTIIGLALIISGIILQNLKRRN